MKRRILTIITIGSVFCMILTGCGVKESVTVSADANVIEGTQFEQVGEKLIEVAEDMKTQLKEHVEEEKIKEEASSTSVPATMPSKEEINEMMEAKMPPWELAEIVTDEAVEEYNRKLKEKEERIFYNPEKIISEYSNMSDAEIIEIVNNRYFELHNELRKELGLPLFERDERLNEVADIRAEEISYFWSHVRPNGESVLGVLSTLEMPSYGENITVGTNYEPSIKGLDKKYCEKFYEIFGDECFEGLCSSPGHYANITETHYTKIGIDSYVIHYEDGVIAVYTAFEFGS